MLDDTPTDADFTEGQGASTEPPPLPVTDPVDGGAGDSGDSGDSGQAKKTAKKTAQKTAKKTTAKKTAAKKATATKATAKKTAAQKSAAQKTQKTTAKSAKKATDAPAQEPPGAPTDDEAAAPGARRSRKKGAAAPPETATEAPEVGDDIAEVGADTGAESTAVPLFQVPEAKPTRRRSAKKAAAEPAPTGDSSGEPEPQVAAIEAGAEGDTQPDSELVDAAGEETPSGRRRRRRGGRRRRKAGDSAVEGDAAEVSAGAEAGAETGAEVTTEGAEAAEEAGEGTSRRRRRRRRGGDDAAEGDDAQGTTGRARKARTAEDEITAVSGSTRLEAKKQRRREGREAGRRRAPIVSEAEFLARRESVERVMVIRQRDDLTQIGVLEDKVLVEHYVARESQTSLIGNVYLGRVQNVLPSMEAAFVDIGKGRNAVLYAGEVNWSALGHPEGQPRKIESVLSSGQQILVQVTKDPVGHKGARLTSQISLAGRFLVYVPDGTTSGISRKLPDTERNRLKTLLKEIVPDTAGVIVRTAAEGASEEELTRDVERLKARWEDIEKKAAKASGAQLLYGEPDLTLKVVRDLFTEDFTKLVIEGDDAWETVQGYVSHVAPDLEGRLERYRPEDNGGRDVFAAFRIDEQIHKGLDRKVWLPSGGSLIIDRTEAMTVVDVNTGKFTGSGGNLEETVTKNNLEAAEEIVRQLRLRDIGGIIVVDFIDMVLESNRELVLRRLVECLGRDRTRHQVAEVTSLGLVQMTRKRIGTGLLEAFSRECEHCNGRGLIVADAPVEPRRTDDEGGRRGRRRGRGADQPAAAKVPAPPSPKVVAAMAQQHGPLDTDPEDAVVEAVEAVEAIDTVEVEVTDAVETVEEMEPVEAIATPAVDGVVDAEPDTGDETAEPVEAAAAAPSEQQDAAEPAPPGESPERESFESSAPAEPSEPPKVVTRTRRRAASRPAGPPAAAAAEEEADAPAGVLVDATDDGAGHDDSDEHGHHDSGPALHVPIKRRGRKR